MKTNHLIQDAGLILLSPFVKSFLSSLGIDPSNPQEKELAKVCLDHLSGLGNENSTDYGLSSVLAGIEPGETHPGSTRIVEGLPMETELCLRQVVNHLDFLHDLSIQAFQQQFLLRPGTLVHGRSGISLYMHPYPLDILWEGVPWNYSLVSLPWLKQCIATVHQRQA